MPVLIVNPYPIGEENIIYDNYTKSLVNEEMSEIHVMHPDLIIPGYDVLYNRVGCSYTTDEQGETIVVKSVHDYLEQLKPTVTSVVDQSASPSIEWSCNQLGLNYSSNGIIPQWDPIPINKGHNRTSSVLKYYNRKMWDIVGDDVAAYILISLIVHDNDVWTYGLKDRSLYLLESPFITKVCLFLRGLAPLPFMSLFNEEMKKVKDVIPVDYVFSSDKIIEYYKAIANREFDTSDPLLDVNEYDSFYVKKQGHCCGDHTFNYV